MVVFNVVEILDYILMQSQMPSFYIVEEGPELLNTYVRSKCELIRFLHII